MTTGDSLNKMKQDDVQLTIERLRSSEVKRDFEETLERINQRSTEMRSSLKVDRKILVEPVTL